MVVVLTGASSGVGRATALGLADRGALLVLAARDEDALSSVVRACEERGVNAVGIPTDVGDAAAVDALAARAIERFGRFDTWINNAGVMAYGEFEDIPPEVFDRVLQTNLHGTVHGCRVALRHFRERERGVLINVCSLWGRISSPLVSPYVTSKFAIRSLSECIHAELCDEEDIDITTILPSATDSPIFENAGNFIGRELRPVWPISSVEYVADGIIACARNPQREVTYGRLGRLLEVLYAVAPPLYRRTAPGMFMGGTLKPTSTPKSPGNVMAPAGEHKTHGGWRSERRGELARAFLGAARGGTLGLLGKGERVKP